MDRPRTGRPDSTGQRLLLIIIGVLSGAIVLEIVFHLAIAPLFTIKRVVVESELTISRDRILEIARIDGSEDFFSLDTGTLVRNLEQYHPVKSATAEKVFPDVVRIVIEARKPVAVAFASENGRSIPLLIDEEGVVFHKGAAGVKDWSLPILSGVQFQQVTVGTRLPALLQPFLEDLQTLKLESPVHFDLISEFRVVKKGEYEMEVVLYPVSHRVPVRIGNSIDEDLCNALIVALDVLDAQGTLERVREIDFRTGEIVYRLREG